VNVMQIPIPFTERIFGRSLVIGSGVLSVMGVSFTFLPVFESSMSQMKNDGYSGIEAYGKMLGTVMVCALLEVFLSIVSTKTLKKVFPPFITGITVFLIGASLIGTGMKYWGGGVVCAEMGWKEHDQAVAAGVNPIPGPACVNGEVVLGYGSPEFLGLGFVVLCGLVLIEIFGSPFMKNANVVIALCFGYLIAAVTNYNGLDYVDSSKIQDAEAITFLWVETFPM
jgi:xanthine/uracil permease